MAWPMFTTKRADSCIDNYKWQIRNIIDSVAANSAFIIDDYRR